MRKIVQEWMLVTNYDGGIECSLCDSEIWSHHFSSPHYRFSVDSLAGLIDDHIRERHSDFHDYV